MSKIQEACQRGDISYIKKLLDVNERDHNDLTPLMLASAYGKQDIVEFLLKSNADVNLKGLNGETALSFAFDQIKISELLINHGADVNSKNADGRTPLMIAVNHRQMDVVSLLIKSGADIDDQNDSGNTIVIILCQKEMTKTNMDIILYFHNKGADFYLENNFGDSALSALQKIDDLSESLTAFIEKLTLEKLTNNIDDFNSLGL